MSEENLDLDAMINNPFRTFRSRSGAPARPESGRPEESAPRPKGAGMCPEIPVARPNAFRGLDAFPASPEPPEPPAERREPAGNLWHDHLAGAQSCSEEERAERNHPLGLRVLALEKNEFVVAKKLDDLRRIVEHQNERIRLLEEELAIYRKVSENGEE